MQSENKIKSPCHIAKYGRGMQLGITSTGLRL
nr:MAG TPA: hypothetical protein [Caudoviricetes sp.]